MRSLKIFFVLVLGWVVAILAIQNPGTIQFKFLNWQTAQVSFIGVILVTALVGFLCGLILSPLRPHKKKDASQE